MVPTQTGKPGKWEGVFQSGNCQGILHKILENVKKISWKSPGTAVVDLKLWNGGPTSSLLSK